MACTLAESPSDPFQGCVLAEDVTAAISLPSFDNSGMDGYAVYAKDTISSSERAPTTLQVTSEIAAGDTGAYRISPGTASKIMTGARMPDGADAVVQVEWTDGGTGRVRVYHPVEPGNAGRYAGRRRRRRRDAAVGRGADAADADRGGRVGGAPDGQGPAQAAGRRAVHGQRADRAGHAAGPRPDRQLQQLHARGRRP